MNARAMGHDARTGLRFFVEALGAILVLAAVTFVARHVRLAPGTPLGTLVQLLPVPAVWLLLLVMLRHYLRIDELQRLQFLQSIALTAGILVGVAWSWPAFHRAFGWSLSDNGMWEVSFSVVFVVISALLTKIRTIPRAR
ncbi:MAG TPA: hypothetical protein VMU08_09345 [Rhizomicrobium sp.]|nr:hypothetical protein [Rhizomicrobium sp.]